MGPHRQSIEAGLAPSELGLKDYFSLVLVTPSAPACYHVDLDTFNGPLIL